MLPLALWLWIAFQTRASALDTAMADQRRVVEAVGENVLKLLDTQALILDIVDRAAGSRDCSALRSDAQFQELLRRSAQQSPNDALLWVINADGHICMASVSQYVDDRDRSFREYFGGARDAGVGHYYVDRAIIGISPPTPAFNISTVGEGFGAGSVAPVMAGHPPCHGRPCAYGMHTFRKQP